MKLKEDLVKNPKSIEAGAPSHLWFTFNYLLIGLIMPAYGPMLEGTYYAWNYASIIC